MDRWHWCRARGQVVTSEIRAMEVTHLAHHWPLTPFTPPEPSEKEPIVHFHWRHWLVTCRWRFETRLPHLSTSWRKREIKTTGEKICTVYVENMTGSCEGFRCQQKDEFAFHFFVIVLTVWEAFEILKRSCVIYQVQGSNWGESQWEVDFLHYIFFFKTTCSDQCTFCKSSKSQDSSFDGHMLLFSGSELKDVTSCHENFSFHVSPRAVSWQSLVLLSALTISLGSWPLLVFIWH